MRCKFCFATFQDVKQSVLPKGHLPKEQGIELVKQLAEYGFQKITFVGGEPTLCPWIDELIYTAKIMGMTTMIVTNGSRIDDAFLERNKGYLDWITISIDSLVHMTNIGMGRAIVGKRPLTQSYYEELCGKIIASGYRLKINTVVSKLNFQEDISDFIMRMRPERWKIFQVLPVVGQNDTHISDFIIDKEALTHFLKTHHQVNNIVKIVCEDNDDMTGSYVMIDPAGRFFDNVENAHVYGEPILKVGITTAIKMLRFDWTKFIGRDGVYDWETRCETVSTISCTI